MSQTLRSWRSCIWWRIRALSLREYSKDATSTRLRLVLGVGRSGTTWTARVLGNTSTPTRLLQEPLFHCRPRLNLTAGADHVAVAPMSRLHPGHRLLTAYRCLLQDKLPLSEVGRDKCIEREDPYWQVCFVKEVHGLLASEAVIRSLGCPTALVVRDPVMTVDSILRTNGFQSGYLEAEARHLLERATEEQIAPGFGRLQSIARGLFGVASRRQQIVLRMFFVVVSLQLLFRRLDTEYECVRLLRYEDLCRRARTRFRSLAMDWGLIWDARAEAFLASCSTAPKTTSPYETRRIAAKQLTRTPSALRPQDVAACQRLFDMSNCNLQVANRLHKAA